MEKDKRDLVSHTQSSVSILYKIYLSKQCTDQL